MPVRSIRPGISVRPVAAMRSAPSASIGLIEILAITLPGPEHSTAPKEQPFFRRKMWDVFEKASHSAGGGAKSEQESRCKYFSAGAQQCEDGMPKKEQRCGTGHRMHGSLQCAICCGSRGFLTHDESSRFRRRGWSRRKDKL